MLRQAIYGQIFEVIRRFCHNVSYHNEKSFRNQRPQLGMFSARGLAARHYHTSRSSQRPCHDEWPMVELNEDSALQVGEYSKIFRAIGCALEALRVEAFELTCEGANYIVRVKSQRKKEAKGVLAVLHRIFPSSRGNSAVGLQLIYTPKEIDWLYHEGKLRRRDAGNPDPHSLTQSLRAIGAYLEIKGARLLKISGSRELFIVRYEAAQDGCNTEEFTPSSLYEFFIRRYLKRHDRSVDSDSIATGALGIDSV